MAKKPRSPIPKPTEAELALLQILWSTGPATVREIHESSGQQKEIGYTSVLKTLQIMLEKGLVQRSTESRAHVYWATTSQAQTQRQLVRELSALLFSGSAVKLAMHALSSEPTSAEEMRELRELINRKQGDK